MGQHLKHVLVMQAYADTFHDFGNENSDKGCALDLGNQSVPAFHKENLGHRKPFNSSLNVADASHPLDQVAPDKLSGQDTYERKVEKPLSHSCVQTLTIVSYIQS